MGILLKWCNNIKKEMHPLAIATIFHHKFEKIHPFGDGNGRVGRILLNNILIKHNLPPININLKNRQGYYESLQEYEKNHNLKPTIELYMKEYTSLKKQLGDYKNKKM